MSKNVDIYQQFINDEQRNIGDIQSLLKIKDNDRNKDFFHEQIEHCQMKIAAFRNQIKLERNTFEKNGKQVI